MIESSRENYEILAELQVDSRRLFGGISYVISNIFPVFIFAGFVEVFSTETVKEFLKVHLIKFVRNVLGI